MMPRFVGFRITISHVAVVETASNGEARIGMGNAYSRSNPAAVTMLTLGALASAAAAPAASIRGAWHRPAA